MKLLMSELNIYHHEFFKSYRRADSRCTAMLSDRTGKNVVLPIINCDDFYDKNVIHSGLLCDPETITPTSSKIINEAWWKSFNPKDSVCPVMTVEDVQFNHCFGNLYHFYEIGYHHLNIALEIEIEKSSSRFKLVEFSKNAKALFGDDIAIFLDSVCIMSNIDDIIVDGMAASSLSVITKDHEGKEVLYSFPYINGRYCFTDATTNMFAPLELVDTAIEHVYGVMANLNSLTRYYEARSLRGKLTKSLDYYVDNKEVIWQEYIFAQDTKGNHLFPLNCAIFNPQPMTADSKQNWMDHIDTTFPHLCKAWDDISGLSTTTGDLYSNDYKAELICSVQNTNRTLNMSFIPSTNVSSITNDISDYIYNEIAGGFKKQGKDVTIAVFLDQIPLVSNIDRYAEDSLFLLPKNTPIFDLFNIPSFTGFNF